MNEHWYIVRFPDRAVSSERSPKYIVVSEVGLADFHPSSGVEVVQEYRAEAEADLNCERLNRAVDYTALRQLAR
jgi:hypothetical protein